MKTDNTYNGWTNYETWNVPTWLTNDYETVKHLESIAIDTIEDYGNHVRTDEALNDIASYIEDMVYDGSFEAVSPSYQSSLYNDLLKAALKEVNYIDIASYFYEDAIEQIES